ncbi:MAG: prefoldin subunit alpha [Candidatus Poseidoniaceae archaeon]|jgi:prefoldin alpha subunit|nr:prefoldin subunit alpha [Candidatus Poseidoniaceae archaeon]
MVENNELQNMARLIDMNRERLEEIQTQIKRIESVQHEHEDAHQALAALSSGEKGHIPIGAGVMIPTSKISTTLVDLGTGIYGERTTTETSKLVRKRTEELDSLKNQFVEESKEINSRIEDLAIAFEKAAKNITKKPVQESTTNIEKQDTSSKSQRRRRGMSSELTLDD